MDEGRKRVLAIVAGILVARHLKTTDDLFDSRSSPRTESLVAAEVQWGGSNGRLMVCFRSRLEVLVRRPLKPTRSAAKMPRKALSSGPARVHE